MGENNKKSGIHITLNESHIKLVGIMFLFFLLTSSKRSPDKFDFKEIDDVELEKKCRLLNRIKGYMSAEEQYIVHRAETILEILGKVKSLVEGPGLHSAEVQYHSLSLEERKRNMLLDLSKHMEGEHRDILHTAIDLDIKVRTVEKKLRELNELTKNGITLENVEKLVELIEPLLEGEIKSKTKDVKRITSIFRLIKSMEEKGSLDEKNLLEIISPYVEPQQRDSLMRMMQIAKAVSNTMNPSGEKDTVSNEESLKQLNTVENLENINNTEKTSDNHHKIDEKYSGIQGEENNT